MGTAVELKDVTLKQGRGGGRITVISGLNLQAGYGEITAITGPSGAGKTTTLRAILGGVRGAEGDITVLGWDLSRISGRRLAAVRRRIGTVPQNPALGQGRTVKEALQEALYATGTGGRSSAERIEEAAVLTGMTAALQREVSVLSAGESRRAGMARALVVRPDLLVLDEPTSNLDQGNAEKVIEVVAAAAGAGLAVLVATHDHQLAAEAHHTVPLERYTSS